MKKTNKNDINKKNTTKKKDNVVVKIAKKKDTEFVKIAKKKTLNECEVDLLNGPDLSSFRDAATGIHPWSSFPGTIADAREENYCDDGWRIGGGDKYIKLMNASSLEIASRRWHTSEILHSYTNQNGYNQPELLLSKELPRKFEVINNQDVAIVVDKSKEIKIKTNSYFDNAIVNKIIEKSYEVATSMMIDFRSSFEKKYNCVMLSKTEVIDHYLYIYPLGEKYNEKDFSLENIIEKSEAFCKKYAKLYEEAAELMNKVMQARTEMYRKYAEVSALRKDLMKIDLEKKDLLEDVVIQHTFFKNMVDNYRMQDTAFHIKKMENCQMKHGSEGSYWSPINSYMTTEQNDSHYGVIMDEGLLKEGYNYKSVFYKGDDYKIMYRKGEEDSLSSKDLGAKLEEKLKGEFSCLTLNEKPEGILSSLIARSMTETLGYDVCMSIDVPDSMKKPFNLYLYKVKEHTSRDDKGVRVRDYDLVNIPIKVGSEEMKALKTAIEPLYKK